MSKVKELPAFDPATVVQTLDQIADLLDIADERLSGQVRAAVSELWGSKPGIPPAACVWYTYAIRTVHDKELAGHLHSAAGAVGRFLSGSNPLLCNLAPREAARRIRVATAWLSKRLGVVQLDQNKQAVTLSRMARILRVPVGWLRTEAEAGRVPHLRAGAVILFDPMAVQRVLVARAGRREVNR